MNELAKVKIRILDRLITYAKDMKKAGALTNDIKVVIGTVKLIIDSEFERAALEQIKTPESVSYEDAVKCFEAINKLSQNYGISYISAKNIIEESMEMLKKSQTNTAKWVVAGVGVDCSGHRFKEYKCSNCGNIDDSRRKNKFCPECGRRMKG